MCEIQVTNTDSNTSTDSWTLLNEHPSNNPEDTHEYQKIDIEGEDVIQEQPRKTKSDGFLTFDEYLQERLLEHDYEYDNKPKTLKIFYTKRSILGLQKCKASNFGITAIIAVMILLCTLANLCSTTYQQPSEFELEEPDTRLENVFEINNETLYKETVFKESNETIKEVEKLLKIRDFLNETKIIMPQNLVDEEMSCSNNTPQVETKPKIEIPMPLPKYNIRRLNKVKLNTQWTKWMIMKELLTNTNLHALISLIMTNVYLFTLLVDISRRFNQDQSLPKNYGAMKEELIKELIGQKKTNEELTKILFLELPFAEEEFSKIPQKLITKRSGTHNSRRSLQTITHKRSPRFSHHHFSCVSLNSCSALKTPPQTALTPILASASCIEAGKSECERRFDELDLYHKKFDCLKQDQRERMKLLKQKFRNEVSYIKDTEEESETRAERINLTSQKYIRKMKNNREKYLIELRKVRELRLKAAEAAKHQKGWKHACVGSYQVTLPRVYSFGQHLNDEKKAEEQSTAVQAWISP